MPTYDYVCDNCGHTFEEFQRMADAHLLNCPKCHEDKLRRLFGTGAGIIFKGSGFYQTDYRSDSYKSGEKADAPPSPPPPPAKADGGSSGSTGSSGGDGGAAK